MPRRRQTPRRIQCSDDDASTGGGDQTGYVTSPKKNSDKPSRGDLMSLLMRDAIKFEENPKQEEVKADGNIPRPSIIKEEDREPWRLHTWSASVNIMSTLFMVGSGCQDY